MAATTATRTTTRPAFSSARCASRAVDPVVSTSSHTTTRTGRRAETPSAPRRVAPASSRPGWPPARPRRGRPGRPRRPAAGAAGAPGRRARRSEQSRLPGGDRVGGVVAARPHRAGARRDRHQHHRAASRQLARHGRGEQPRQRGRPAPAAGAPSGRAPSPARCPRRPLPPRARPARPAPASATPAPPLRAAHADRTGTAGDPAAHTRRMRRPAAGRGLRPARSRSWAHPSPSVAQLQQGAGPELWRTRCAGAGVDASRTSRAGPHAVDEDSMVTLGSSSIWSARAPARSRSAARRARRPRPRATKA